jgi:hypothetical protein
MTVISVSRAGPVIEFVPVALPVVERLIHYRGWLNTLSPGPVVKSPGAHSVLVNGSCSGEHRAGA